MIALFHERVSEGRDRVTHIHYKPHLLSAEQRDAAILIEDEALPVREDRPGKTAVLYVNLETKAVSVEYEDRPPTEDELLAEISGKLTEMSQKLTTLIDLWKAR